MSNVKSLIYFPLSIKEGKGIHRKVVGKQRSFVTFWGCCVDCVYKYLLKCLFLNSPMLC